MSLASGVVTGAQKMGEATGRRDVGRAGLQLVRYDGYFSYIDQLVTA